MGRYNGRLLCLENRNVVRKMLSNNPLTKEKALQAVQFLVGSVEREVYKK